MNKLIEDCIVEYIQYKNLFRIDYAYYRLDNANLAAFNKTIIELKKLKKGIYYKIRNITDEIPGHIEINYCLTRLRLPQ